MNENEFEKKLDGMTVPEASMPEHKEQLGNELQNVRKTPMLGAFLIVVLTIILTGESLLMFVNPPSALIVFGIAILLVTATYGFKGLRVIFTAVVSLDVRGDERDDYLGIIRDFRYYLIGAGWIGFILGFILMAANYSDPDAIGPGLSVALLTVFYAYVTAYCYCYPIQRRLENNPG